MSGMDLPVSSCSSTTPALRGRGEQAEAFFISSSSFWSPTSPPDVTLASVPFRLPLCDYPAEGRVREEPRVRRQENGFCQQIKFTDNSQKKVKLASCQDKELLTRFPPVANIIRFVRPSLFPKQCKGYMAPNNQLYGPIDVKHDCDTNNIWWKQNDEESLMQMLKSYLWQARPPMHNGNGAALKTYR